MCVQPSPPVQNGQTPFLTAAAKGHVEVAGFLLENGSSILERANVSGYYSLSCAYKCTLAMTSSLLIQLFVA